MIIDYALLAIGISFFAAIPWLYSIKNKGECEKENVNCVMYVGF